MTDDEDDETAYIILPESPKRSDRNCRQTLVPRERAISAQGEFSKQQTAGDDDITYIEVIVNDVRKYEEELHRSRLECFSSVS